MTRGDGLSACDCHQCGGAAARNDAILAARVMRYASFVPIMRGQNAREIANRHAPADLYSRLIMRAAAAPMR